MSSIHESFAQAESGFISVGRKKPYNKSKFQPQTQTQPLKPMAEIKVKSIETPTKVNVNVIENLPAPKVESEASVEAESSPSDTKSDDAGSTTSKPRGPRKPPTGIFVNLGAEWKKFVRDLIPNKSSRTSDDTVMNKISTVKSNPSVSNFEFKKIVCMIFHQALKTDRNTLVDKIISCWTRSGYNIIELIDSTYDGCKPMTQACWSGSIYCIQRLVAADTSNSVLYTVHPTKNETILDTLLLGKNYAIQKEPETALFAADRFDKCEKFIRTSMQRHEAASKASASASNPSDAPTISPELKESIDEIVGTEGVSDAEIVEQLTLKLVDLFLEDQSKSCEYFAAVKATIGSEIFVQIDSRLKDEGIEIN